MNIGTFIVLLVLLAFVALIVRSMIQDKRKGRSIQCGGDCGHCGGYCHQVKNMVEENRHRN